MMYEQVRRQPNFIGRPSHAIHLTVQCSYCTGIDGAYIFSQDPDWPMQADSTALRKFGGLHPHEKPEAQVCKVEPSRAIAI